MSTKKVKLGNLTAGGGCYLLDRPPKVCLDLSHCVLGPHQNGPAALPGGWTGSKAARGGTEHPPDDRCGAPRIGARSAAACALSRQGREVAYGELGSDPDRSRHAGDVS